VAVTESRLSNIMITGDFNYSDIDYAGYFVNAGPQSEQQIFFDKTQDLFLLQHVKEPTRSRGNSSSCLDLIFTTEENVIENLQHEVPIGSSDHVCLTWDVVAEVVEMPSVDQKNFNYWKADFDAISRELMLVNWDDAFRSRSVEEMWIDTLTDLAEKYVPVKTVHSG